MKNTKFASQVKYSMSSAHENSQTVLSARLVVSRDAVRREKEELTVKRLAEYREHCTMKTFSGDQLVIAAKMLLAEGARLHTVLPPKRGPPRPRQMRTPGAAYHLAYCQGPPRYNLADVRIATVIADDIDTLMCLEVSPLQRQQPGGELSSSQWGPNALSEYPTHVLNYHYVMSELAKLRMWT